MARTPPEILFSLISCFTALTARQLHHITHSFLGSNQKEIESELAALVDAGLLNMNKQTGACCIRPGALARGSVAPGDLPMLGMYFTGARPHDVLSEIDTYTLIDHDVNTTNNLNTVIANAVALGAVSLPGYLERSANVTTLDSSSQEQGIAIHQYCLEDYFVSTEEYAWELLMESKTAEMELADTKLRAYITSQFFHLLFCRPDFLVPGGLFDRSFVEKVHPRLTCIHDIASITSDRHEQIALFMSTSNQLGTSSPGALPPDFSV